MPGWVSADGTIRHRIVETAPTYLTAAQSSMDLWFGKNPMPLHSNDLSAVRAFILLRQQAPDAYAAIPQVVWEKWTPVIVGLRLSVGNEFSDDVRDVQRDALANAPTAFVSAVRKMLHMEKAQARASSDAHATSVAHPFLVLRNLEGCWDDEGLKVALFDEMRDRICVQQNTQPCSRASLARGSSPPSNTPSLNSTVSTKIPSRLPTFSSAGRPPPFGRCFGQNCLRMKPWRAPCSSMPRAISPSPHLFTRASPQRRSPISTS